jgi:hypothetical protein
VCASHYRVSTIYTLNYIQNLFKSHIRNTQFSQTGSGTDLDDGDKEPEAELTLMTVTRNLFSSSSCMEPEMLPMAQHSVFRFFQLHSVPFT